MCLYFINSVDDLYKFLNHWVPELYGELGDVTERGYILVDSDTELSDDETGTSRVKVYIFYIKNIAYV